MTVAEMIKNLSFYNKDQKVVIYADHSQNAETVTSVGDCFMDENGDLYDAEDIEAEGYDLDDFKPVVVIWGQ